MWFLPAKYNFKNLITGPGRWLCKSKTPVVHMTTSVQFQKFTRWKSRINPHVVL